MYRFDEDSVLELACSYLEDYYSNLNRKSENIDTNEIENYIKLVYPDAEIIVDVNNGDGIIKYDGYEYDISTEEGLSDLLEIADLWGTVNSYAEELIEDRRDYIIDDFYVETKDEEGNILEEETFLDEYALEESLKDYINSREASRDIADYIKTIVTEDEYVEDIDNTDIYYRIGDTTITNENGDTHPLKGVWIKLSLRSDYTLEGFYINRDTYTMAEIKAGYMHSHVPTIDRGHIRIENKKIEWGSPCLGYGIVSDYVNLLNAEAKPSDYLNLILYIEDYVKTESLIGVPYIKAESVNTYAQTYNTLSTDYRNYFLTQNLDKKLISSYYTEFNPSIYSPNNPYFAAYVLTNNPGLLICSNKEIKFSMNLFNVWSLISNAYLEYVNAYFPSINTYESNPYLRYYYITPDFNIKLIHGIVDLNEEIKAVIKVGNKTIPIKTVEDSKILEGELLIDIRHFISIIDYITSITE